MSEPFLAEILIVGFNFPPRGFAFCDGQILPINQNQSLYSLLGTTYGGDGRTSFGLPDLRGRTPLGVDGNNGHPWGEKSGQERENLSLAQMPKHTHTARAANVDAATDDPTNAIINRPGSSSFAAFNSPGNMGSGTIANSGGNQGHNNMQPYLAINFCIALQGLFPSRN